MAKKLSTFSFAITVFTQHISFEISKAVNFAYAEFICNHGIELWYESFNSRKLFI